VKLIRKLEIKDGLYSMCGKILESNDMSIYMSHNSIDYLNATRKLVEEINFNLFNCSKNGKTEEINTLYNNIDEKLKHQLESHMHSDFIELDIDEKEETTLDKLNEMTKEQENKLLYETKNGYHLLINVKNKETDFIKDYKKYITKNNFNCSIMNRHSNSLIPGTYQNGYKVKIVEIVKK